ncbi:hypothetical protein VD0002_g1679 [Verticillium dahliae]|uniref:Mesaconyl-C4 CoA hydratase n=2 Tax=Verticillium dahliae TaxID=27337 RepID=G2X0X2_VERDV|nr:uncharacterized protein VDAG_03901 [Verticillium dahliae VdLs.17]KAF3343959.1 Homocitrate synthase [Verticillium dahliae VDG2]KAH6704884.1 hypothetical protein EV126DRAFT_492525 [Verticillium dahliae]EGY22463.1 hypothetical protein VDAG_03901 [Verticillium dahliae VdLs.17]PNH31796.1 hypothetical protein BJF96_g5065 [Verticillium dahliae]PNH43359.1 hypothetical protein VD0004_g4121 [Verticillium dahliae]
MHFAGRMARRIAHSAACGMPRFLSSMVDRPVQKKTASEAALRLLESFADITVTRRQVVDGNQLQKLSLTLGRRRLARDLDVSISAPPTGTPLPHGYHLVYFTPNGIEGELGADGTDKTFNAPAPFSRRMWAGGKMTWPAREQPIRVGDEVEERTRLLSATAKTSRRGEDMVLVDVEKEFWGPNGLALVDQRSWIFRPEINPEATIAVPQPKALKDLVRGPSTCEDIAYQHDAPPLRRLSWSSVGLFRFSALTFNGHMIHYNQEWSRDVEGHPGAVVHGPLNLISMLDYWRDVHGKGQSPREIAYRALSPIYAGETYDIRTVGERVPGDDKGWDISVEKGGTICMKAQILG